MLRDTTHDTHSDSGFSREYFHLLRRDIRYDSVSCFREQKLTILTSLQLNDTPRFLIHMNYMHRYTVDLSVGVRGRVGGPQCAGEEKVRSTTLSCRFQAPMIRILPFHLRVVNCLSY